MGEIVDRKGKSAVIPEAEELAAVLQSLPAGELSDLAQVRKTLAASAGAEMCCPVTVQRQLVAFSESDDVPFWRVVDADRPFAKRMVGGPDRVRELLANDI